MVGKTEGCHKKKDLNKSQYEKDETDIENVRHTIELLQNLFTYEKELINIASGQVAPSEIKEGNLTAHEKGCNFSSQFVQRRLIWKQVEFSASLKTMKMKTFSYLLKKRPQKKNMKETDCLKADKYLFTRFLIVARTQKVDLGEILTLCLSQFPFSLSNNDGSLQRTKKVDISHCLSPDKTWPEDQL